MSSAPRDQKKMWVADVVLRRAARLVPAALAGMALPTELDKIDVASARTANLKNLDFLESLGVNRDLRGGFWRDLMRACEMLDSPERMERLTDQYRAALQRVGESPARSESKSMRDWIFEENLVPWLEMTARIAKYELHPAEPQAFVHGLKDTDSEHGRWFEYEFHAVRLNVARDPGTSLLSVELNLPAALVPRIETVTEVAQSYQLRERDGKAAG